MAAFRSKYNSSSDDSDSGDDETPWKRKCNQELKTDNATFVNPLAGQKPKFKNTVWSNVLTDQSVSGELCNFEIKEDKVSDTLVDREVESYRVTDDAIKTLYGSKSSSKYEDLDAADDGEMDTNDEEEDDDDGDDFAKMLASYQKAKTELAKQPKDLREKLKEKKGKRKHEDDDMRYRIAKNRQDRLEKQNVGANSVFTSDAKFQTDVKRAAVTDSKEEVLQCLLETLQEKNDELFTNILDKIGNEKALDILNKTEDVETSGGMMIQSGVRRRTPGGVFIQLLRADPSMTPEELKELFPVVQNREEKKKRRDRQRREARRRKRMTDAKQRDGEAIPDLLDIHPKPQADLDLKKDTEPTAHSAMDDLEIEIQNDLNSKLKPEADFDLKPDIERSGKLSRMEELEIEIQNDKLNAQMDDEEEEGEIVSD